MKLLVSLTMVAQALISPLPDPGPEFFAIATALSRHGGPVDRVPQVASMILAQSKRWKIDPLLVAAVMTVENPWLISDTASHVGAMGLMQIMPFWTGHLSARCGPDLTNDWTNLCYGINILHIFHQREAYQWEPALLAYNGCKTIERCGKYPRMVLQRRERMAQALN